MNQSIGFRLGGNASEGRAAELVYGDALLARHNGGGELSLRVQAGDGALRIEVGNPGRIEPESVRRGVGLAYLRTRLAHAPAPG